MHHQFLTDLHQPQPQKKNERVQTIENTVVKLSANSSVGTDVLILFNGRTHAPNTDTHYCQWQNCSTTYLKKHSPCSITERKVPQLTPVLGSQPAGDVCHKPGGRLPLLSARPAVTLVTLKRADTSFAAW